MNRQTAISPAIPDFTAGTSLTELVAQAKRAVGRIITKIRMMEQVRTERAQLATLNSRLLRDIGVDNASAHQESARSVFDLPSGRL